MISQRVEWTIELPSTLEAIELFCEEFQLWRANHCPGVDSFSSELVLREALTNSVLYGNSEAADKRISCVLRARRQHLFIAVRDSGEGFDWREAWNRPADDDLSHGRGMEILKRYATVVRFNSTGNSVMLIKRFKQVKTNE